MFNFILEFSKQRQYIETRVVKSGEITTKEVKNSPDYIIMTGLLLNQYAVAFFSYFNWLPTAPRTVTVGWQILCAESRTAYCFQGACTHKWVNVLPIDECNLSCWSVFTHIYVQICMHGHKMLIWRSLFYLCVRKINAWNCGQEYWCLNISNVQMRLYRDCTVSLKLHCEL